MAVGTSYSFNLTLEELIANGARLAGVLGAGDTISGAEVTMGGHFLNMLMKEWQAAARLLRQVERVTKTLTSGTATVTVDADTIDIEFPAYITPATGSQTYEVDRMTLDEYMRLPNKSEQGIPEMALVERKDTVVMTLWPVPDATVTSITYARVKLIRDIAAGENPDVHQRYLAALTWGIAWMFAEHYGKDDAKIARLEAKYSAAQRVVFRDNVERGHVKFRLG